MTEITRVPLQPIAKGALSKLWLGVAAALLVAGGIAWATVPKFTELKDGVMIREIEEGKGGVPGATDFVLVNYKGTLDDGTVFDQGERAPMQVNGVVPGFSTALQHMRTGGKYEIRIPAAQAYGDRQQPGLPANSDLTFEVELLDTRSEAEVQAMQQQMMMQQMMQQQQQGGAPGAMPPGAIPPGAIPPGAMPPGPPQP